MSMGDMDEIPEPPMPPPPLPQVPPADLEEKRRQLNTLFGFSKWKSHVTQRELSQRSTIVQDLYREPRIPSRQAISASFTLVNTITVGNIAYLLFVGWWLSFVYVLFACLFAVSIIGWNYSKLCFRLAGFFLWPFGKFLQRPAPYVVLLDDEPVVGETRRGARERASSSITIDSSTLQSEPLLRGHQGHQEVEMGGEDEEEEEEEGGGGGEGEEEEEEGEGEGEGASKPCVVAHQQERQQTVRTGYGTMTIVAPSPQQQPQDDSSSLHESPDNTIRLSSRVSRSASVHSTLSLKQKSLLKHQQQRSHSSTNGGSGDEAPLTTATSLNLASRSVPSSSEGPDDTEQLGFAVWCMFFAPILVFFHIVAAFLTWMSVVMIPMSKVTWTTWWELFRQPTSLVVGSIGTEPQPGHQVVVCTYQAVNRYYYKYSVGGMNVCLVNFIPFIVCALLFGYVPGMKIDDMNLIFALSVVAVVPVAFYIGAAIECISVQSTFAVGAVINATFGSVIELFIYYTSLRKSYLTLVRASLTGSLLGLMLFIPGLCMVIGGIRHKKQRFNAASASVSSLLLFVSIIGAFTPSFFQKIYGMHSITCDLCTQNVTVARQQYSQLIFSADANVQDTPIHCDNCDFVQSHLGADSVYTDSTLPLTYGVSVLLPIAYIIGLIFTLKTHTYIYEPSPPPPTASLDPPSSSSAPHHSTPLWGRGLSVTILLIASVTMALLAELIVDNLGGVLEATGLGQEFVGVTIIAIVPNIAEIINGIQFALQDNIELSIEIGYSIVVQVCLIQMPVLVAIGAIMDISSGVQSFPLIFNDLQIVLVLLSVFLSNYVLQDGSSNYFQGSAMLAFYLIAIMAFYWSPTNVVG